MYLKTLPRRHLLPLRFTPALFYKKLSDFQEKYHTSTNKKNIQKSQNEVFNQNFQEKIQQEGERLENPLSQAAGRTSKNPGGNETSPRKVQRSKSENI